MKGNGEGGIPRRADYGVGKCQRVSIIRKLKVFLGARRLGGSSRRWDRKGGHRPVCWRALLTHSSDDWNRKAEARSHRWVSHGQR